MQRSNPTRAIGVLGYSTRKAGRSIHIVLVWLREILKLGRWKVFEAFILPRLYGKGRVW